MFMCPGRKILVVEDEALILMMVMAKLRSYGYEVVSAACGERAVELADEDPDISLILMDIDLGPGLSGPEAAEAILEKRHLPIVFHTSHAEREMVERVKGITRYGYVLKNSGDFVLRSSLEMAFELFSVNAELREKTEILRARTEMLENVIEHFPGMVFWKSSDSVILGCNSEFRAVAGLSNRDLSGGIRDAELPRSGHQADRYRAEDLRVIESSRALPVIEEEIPQPDGRTLWYETRKIPLFGSEARVSGILGVSVDITRHKLAELELRKLAARLQELNHETRRIADAMPNFIWASDESGRCSFMNKARLDFSGKRLEDFLGSAWLEDVHPEDRARVYEQSSAAFASRSEIAVGYRVKSRDGTWHQVLDRGLPRFTAEGEFIGYSGIMELLGPVQ